MAQANTSATYLLALDQGTTSARAILFDTHGKIVGIAQQEIAQHYPQPGWVEHDPIEIWQVQKTVMEQVVAEHQINPATIAAVGITNQRETTILWERNTGSPVAPAIVWQDRRTAPLCEKLKQDGLTDYIRQQTGLMPDPYFSATKLAWLLDAQPSLRQRAANGELLFGTVDTWLLWNLSGGKLHVTDTTNASRTMLYNIRQLCWDQTLLDALNIPRAILPEVRESAADYGYCEVAGNQVLIGGVAGDQQAALFGQACFNPGEAKNTYGTGCFLLMNTGAQPCDSQHGLLATIAWSLTGKTFYAIEGSVLSAGAAIQWLRDELQIISSAAASEAVAATADCDNDIVMVPAFAGLGAPHWDMYARGAIFGLTRGTTRAQIVRATLESLAMQTRDILIAMQGDTNITLNSLRVDGGAAANNLLMQMQADLLGVPVERPEMLESTAFGAACLAGITAGIWDQSSLTVLRATSHRFTPQMAEATRKIRCERWQQAVRRTLGWAQPTN